MGPGDQSLFGEKVTVVGGDPLVRTERENPSVIQGDCGLDAGGFTLTSDPRERGEVINRRAVGQAIDQAQGQAF